MRQVGDNVTVERSIVIEDLELFANLSLDRNKIHFDDEFAKTSYFGKPIAHGMIGAALISGALTSLMGDGNVWLDAQIKFQKPIFIGDHLKIYMEIQSITRRGVATLSFEICNAHRELTIIGSVTSLQTSKAHK